MLRGGALFFILTLIAFLPAYADMNAQMNSSSAPYTVGHFKVTALLDGTVNLGLGGYKGVPQEQVQALVDEENILRNGAVPTSVNAYLIDTGNLRVLIDAGNASCYSWNMGGLEQSLLDSGYNPGQIDMIFLTHLHGDHVCGLVKNGKKLFANATIYVARDEAAYWLDSKKSDSTAKQALATLALYNNVFRTFSLGEKVLPWLTPVAAFGHTPGHTAYLVQSEEQALLIWGDIIHCFAIQLPRPDISIVSDIDTNQAIATRKALLEKVSSENLAVAGAHLPFPGVGHIRRKGDHYVWEPLISGPISGRHP
jgi:glyoxylase-like metal-dependent hydrolase (beta-lactamase superfamily II)